MGYNTVNINLKDVAKKAGVSLGTASKVINNIYTKPETKKRVLDAMEDLKYTPNFVARSLKTQNTNTIGVIVSDISSPVASKILAGIENICRLSEYKITIYDTQMKEQEELKAIDIFRTNMIDGIIYTSNTISKKVVDKFKWSEIPVVLVATSCDDKYVNSVTINNQLAAKEAVEYIINKGHRNIGMLSGSYDDPNAGKPRIDGYKQALFQNNIKYNEKYIAYGDYRMQSGYQETKKLISENSEISAIFCASDEMAFGAIKVLNDMGISVPDQISVVGFDGIELTDYAIPSITTVEQPLFEFGEKGMELLLNKINNGEDIGNIVLPHNLKEKGSS